MVVVAVAVDPMRALFAFAFAFLLSNVYLEIVSLNKRRKKKRESKLSLCRSVCLSYSGVAP